MKPKNLDAQTWLCIFVGGSQFWSSSLTLVGRRVLGFGNLYELLSVDTDVLE